MIGSWAGAMGQTQFLPSNFLAYAVDADGDGRRDIWGSMADVHGLDRELPRARRAGRRASPGASRCSCRPDSTSPVPTPTLRQTSAQWAAEGVQSIDGAPLPTFDDGAILLPAGARGPAFLVGPNFRAILRYNNSTSYALAVGLLAQRLAGGPGVQAPWPRDLQALTRSQLLELQTALNERGFDSGTPDGLMGPATRGGDPPLPAQHRPACRRLPHAWSCCSACRPAESASPPMSDLAPLPDAPLGLYRHYKGGEYEVIGVARHSETHEPLVVYRPLYNKSGWWVRPHAMFFGTVEVDGVPRARFERLD